MESSDALRRENEALRRENEALETLIETSPVGVVVFDAGTGEPVSFNREASRLVGRLSLTDQAPADLLKTTTCRFTDGRRVALDEVPLAQVLSTAETMRAEEVVLSVPDGRSIRMLVNATPIRSPGGTIESVVATMQDLTALNELERLQTEFLGMVSHELRAPLTSIKGSAAALLHPSPELDPAEMRAFHRIIDHQANHLFGLIGDLLDAGRIETGTLSVVPEPAEVAGLVDQARNTFLSGGGRQAVHIDLPRDLPRVMADRRRVVQVLNNLLSNAARHSPDASTIRVAAAPDGVHVAISVSDEGQGVPPVIFISAYGRDETLARALELGAADYIVKPFSPTELTARVRAALRKRAEPERFRIGDLAIDYEQRRVTVAGRSVRLTATEYELLRLLSINTGRVLTRAALLRHLRGGRAAADSTAIRTLVRKLRRKLGDDAAGPSYVLTEHGVGYRIATPADP